MSAIIDLPLLVQGYEVGLNWLGKFARAIIEGVGSIGLGIILFTLVLKAITLPFDIYQRVKMRKQTLIMRAMKDDLDKLQKQYANDKEAYNAKMMELYKKNGYSVFSACLPLIISLVILIVAFQGFRTYSQYANLNLFVNMSQSYNAAILENGVEGKNYRLHREGAEDGELTLPFGISDYQDGWTKTEDGVRYTVYTVTQKRDKLDENGAPVIGEDGRTVTEEVSVPYMRVESEDESKFVFYHYNLEAAEIVRSYQVDVGKLYSDNHPEAKAAIDAYLAETADLSEEEAISAAAFQYVTKLGASAAKVWYEENDPGFLWVKNVWYPDVSYNHPIPSYKTFSSQLNVNVTFTHEDGSKEKQRLASVLTESQYNVLTSELGGAKKQANGYFILIILSIGTMALSQFLTMRSSKESNEYQTVDGSAASTQKIMLFVMPIIYAIFAFMYSAAFSIYMTVSSLISLGITLLSNFILDKIFRKKEEEALKEQYGRKLPWMETSERTDKKGKRKK